MPVVCSKAASSPYHVSSVVGQLELAPPALAHFTTYFTTRHLAEPHCILTRSLHWTPRAFVRIRSSRIAKSILWSYSCTMIKIECHMYSPPYEFVLRDSMNSVTRHPMVTMGLADTWEIRAAPLS